MQQQLHFQSEPAMEYGGIFGEEDNKFMFPNVIVGKKTRARIKIANPTKVPCDVVVTQVGYLFSSFMFYRNEVILTFKTNCYPTPAASSWHRRRSSWSRRNGRRRRGRNFFELSRLHVSQHHRRHSLKPDRKRGQGERRSGARKCLWRRACKGECVCACVRACMFVPIHYLSSLTNNLSSNTQASIPAYGHFYATITFTPAAMQTYNTVFDVVIDLGLPQGVRNLGRVGGWKCFHCSTLGYSWWLRKTYTPIIVAHCYFVFHPSTMLFCFSQLPAGSGAAAPTVTAFDASSGERLGKQLTFEVLGEGVLPRVSITRPTIRTRGGQPLLLYKKLLTERTQTLTFALYNDGTLSCTVS